MKRSSPVQISSDLSLLCRISRFTTFLSNLQLYNFLSIRKKNKTKDEKFVAEKFGSNRVETFYLSYSVREKYLKLLKFIQLAFFQLFIWIENKHSWKIFDTVIFSSLRWETNFQFLCFQRKRTIYEDTYSIQSIED